MSEKKRVIAVDFDGTLADDSRVKYPLCGPPIPAMVSRVRRWISDGHTVKIYTARLVQKDREEEKRQVMALTEWLDLINLVNLDGTPLVLTAMKLPEFDEFWDDKAVRVIRNTGATYGNNYYPASGLFGISKEESSKPRNEEQGEFEFAHHYKTLEQKISSLPAERQERINARAEALRLDVTPGPSLGPIGQSFEAWRRAAENIPEDPFIDPREPYTR